MWPVAVSFWWACTSAGDSSALKESDAPDGMIEAEIPAPQWDAATVTERTQAMLDLGFPDLDQMIEVFKARVDEGGDGHCPNVGNYSMTNSFSGCVSEKGYRYAGLSIYTQVEEDVSLVGDCYITDPAGLTFYCAGELEKSTDGGTQSLKMTGTWGHPEDPYPWLSTVPSMALWAEKTADTQLVSGGLGQTWPVGGDRTQIYLDGINRSGTCVTGQIRLRDPGGSWYRLENAECSGLDELCGNWEYDGTELGESCLNFRNFRVP